MLIDLDSISVDEVECKRESFHLGELICEDFLVISTFLHSDQRC